MNRINGFISAITGILVLFLTGAAFILSFHALADLALSAGVSGSLAWLYPAIIDGAIIVFSLSVLRANLSGDRAAYPWLLVGLFTVLSVVLNIVHAQATLLGRFLAAIPPVALFLSFELLMTQVKAQARRTDAVESLKEITQKTEAKGLELDAFVQEKAAERARLESEIRQLEQKREKMLNEFDRLETDQTTPLPSNIAQLASARQAKLVNKQEAMKKLLTFLGEHPNASFADMAEVIERSKSTASNYARELQGTGILSKNGSGWIVNSG